MSETLTFVELLAELGGAKLLEQRSDGVLAAVVVALPAERKILAVERTYRQGIGVILDPTDDEVETVRSGDLWTLWNSERAKGLGSLSRESYGSFLAD